MTTRWQRGRYEIDLDVQTTTIIDGEAWPSNITIHIENALSITVSHGFDQDISICTVVVPWPLDSRIHTWQQGYIYMGTSGNPDDIKRFEGYITDLDYSFTPATVTITFSDVLVRAQHTYPRHSGAREADPSAPGPNFAGMTDEAIVAAVLDDVQLFAIGTIDGTGEVMSPEELIWPEAESAFEVIQEVDAWAKLEDGSGYRTFVTADGDVVRRLLQPFPADGTPVDFTFTEGVDIFVAQRQYQIRPATDPTTLTVAADPLVPGDTAALLPFISFWDDVAGRGVMRATLVTYREDLFPINSVVTVASPHLDSLSTYLFWLQAVTTAIDEQGAFTQTLQLITEAEQFASIIPTPTPTAPPCGSGIAKFFVEYGTTMWAYRTDDTWDERGTFVGTSAFSGQQILSDDPFFVYGADGNGLYRSASAACALDFTSSAPPVVQAGGIVHSRDRSYAYGSLGRGAHMVSADVWTQVATSTGPLRTIAQLAAGPTTLWYVSQSADGASYNAYAAALDGSGATLLGTYGGGDTVRPIELWGSKTSNALALGFDRVGHSYKLTASGIAAGGTMPTMTGPRIVYANSKDGTTWLALAVNPSTLTSNTCHLFRSTDGGSSWASVLTGTHSAAGEFFRPAYGDAAGEWMVIVPDTGLYRSTDDGATWALVAAPVGAVGAPHAVAGVAP